MGLVHTYDVCETVWYVDTAQEAKLQPCDLDGLHYPATLHLYRYAWNAGVKEMSTAQSITWIESLDLKDLWDQAEVNGSMGQSE